MDPRKAPAAPQRKAQRAKPAALRTVSAPAARYQALTQAQLILAPARQAQFQVRAQVLARQAQLARLVLLARLPALAQLARLARLIRAPAPAASAAPAAPALNRTGKIKERAAYAALSFCLNT